MEKKDKSFVIVDGKDYGISTLEGCSPRSDFWMAMLRFIGNTECYRKLISFMMYWVIPKNWYHFVIL